MVSLVGNGYGDPSSNPGRGCLHFSFPITGCLVNVEFPLGLFCLANGTEVLLPVLMLLRCIKRKWSPNKVKTSVIYTGFSVETFVANYNMYEGPSKNKGFLKKKKKQNTFFPLV